METKEYQLISNKCPHISKKIMLLWGSQEMNRYFSDLFINTRYGARKGFPKQLADSLEYLKDKHKIEFPKLLNILIE
ncbi:hypothetical protein M0R04_04360 [Candidatus Dojkabacteria bacterium]|jgi:hypothetical protein|nr:hypothetical protein [Candidatus Dojkabacteria bacterium]